MEGIDGLDLDMLAQHVFDPDKFVEEAWGELRACMEESMPQYVDKGLEMMMAPPGERLQKMEYLHNKLAARCSKMPVLPMRKRAACESTSTYRTSGSRSMTAPRPCQR